MLLSYEEYLAQENLAKALEYLYSMVLDFVGF